MEALDAPHLPQRLVAVEPLRLDAAGELLEMSPVTERRKPGEKMSTSQLRPVRLSVMVSVSFVMDGTPAQLLLDLGRGPSQSIPTMLGQSRTSVQSTIRRKQDGISVVSQGE